MKGKQLQIKDLPEAIQKALQALEDKKTVQPVVIDMRQTDAPARFFIIGTGESDLHVKAILDELEHQRKTQFRLVPYSREGTDTRRWAVLDYLDFIVHIFRPEAREYYALEDLWSDCPQYLVLPGQKLQPLDEIPIKED